MRQEVLRYLRDRGGVPVTELATAFDLPAEMAANLLIQLQDAGLLAEHELGGCAHLGGACAGCDASGCSSGAGFTHGCCGLNAPYQLTPLGHALLAPPLAEEDPMAHHLHDLRTLDPAGWEGLLALGTPHRYEAGQDIFLDKAGATSLFVLVKGEIEILKPAAPGHAIRLARLAPDSLFGAGALFARQARSAHARALVASEVLELPATAVTAYLDQHDAFAHRFFRHLCDVQHRIIANLDTELGELHERLERVPQ